MTRGVAELGHTASFYWQGKMPAAAYFTTVPFGLTPQEHVAWVEAGGGQALWDELYRPFGVKPFMGGNTGVCMGGWFRRELRGLDDVRGLKIRSLGLGGEVYRRLGEALTLGEAGRDRGGERAAGAVGVLRVDLVRAKARQRGGRDEQVHGSRALRMAALDQHGFCADRDQRVRLCAHLVLVLCERQTGERGRLVQVRRDHQRAREEIAHERVGRFGREQAVA